MPDGFAGSAVLSADVPIVATYVQYSKNETASYSRVFYSGFDESKAGSTFYLPTVRANGVTTSTVGVQNVESFEITATLDFYAVGASSPTFTHEQDIKPNASYVSALPDIPEYPGGSFDGSLVVNAAEKGEPSTPGRVVASAQETQDNGRGVFGYEGSKEGATTAYVPTATCNRAAFQGTSYLAIQNAGSATAQVKVSYYDTAGTKVGEMPETPINEGAKLQTNPCQQSLLVNALGSAVVESTNGVPIIVIGKYATNDGLITAFTCESAGSLNVAAPYIRWAADPTTNYRAYIAVMNVGSGAATSIVARSSRVPIHVWARAVPAARQIAAGVARYYDASGTERGSETLASGGAPLGQFIKANTNPSTAGALIGGSFGISPFGGAVEIESDQPVVVLVRLTTNPSGLEVATLGEDYNGAATAP